MRYPTGTGVGAPAVEVMVLGTVGIRRGDEWCAPPTGLLRALLATLALAGAETTAPALIDAVWQDRAGSIREATVAVAIHRLRRWLAASVHDAVRISRPASGYLLEVPGGGTDLERFRGLIRQAPHPERDPQGRAAVLSDALVEDAVRRALVRMTDGMVRRIVVETAERLIREEIEKIKAHSE